MVATENASTIRCIAIASPQLLPRCVTRRCLETVFYCCAVALLIRCLGNDRIRGLQYPGFPAARHNMFKTRNTKYVIKSQSSRPEFNSCEGARYFGSTQPATPCVPEALSPGRTGCDVKLPTHLRPMPTSVSESPCD
jgi:hypothetical protein